VNGTGQSIEFHVIGENIQNAPRFTRLHIVERLRNEQKFANLDALVTQMRTDIVRAAKILSLGQQ
jgi:FAD synthase